MKNTVKHKAILLLCFCLLSTPSLFAQYWTPSGSAIYNDNATQVGIGESNPQARLTVKRKLTDTYPSLQVIEQDGNNYYMQLVVDQGGNVGIGTGSPAEKLDVDGTIKCSNLRMINSPSPGFVLTSDAAGNATWQAPDNDDDNWIRLPNDDLMAATYGKVSIGTLTPEARMHINNVVTSGITNLPFKITREVPISPGVSSINTQVLVSEEGFLGLNTDSPTEMINVIDGDIEISGSTGGAFRVTNPNETSATCNFSWKNGFPRIRFGGSGSSNANGFQIQGLGDDVILHCNDNQSVFIGGGTVVPNGFKLAVSGKIIAEEVRVQLETNWPDYVFAEDYDLMPLEDLATYIEANHHLPGIPQAQIIESEGMEVGDMQAKLMEKVEELTLYLLEMQKANKALEEKVEQLEAAQ